MEPTFTCECPIEPNTVRRLYVVTGHDGSSRVCAYCATCVELAAVDWTGETASIAPHHSRAVVTHRAAYSDRQLRVCTEHADVRTADGWALGPVSHGLHRGTCDVTIADLVAERG